MKIAEILRQKGAIVDSILDELLPPSGLCPEQLHASMRYSTLAGGKRLRPVLALCTYELFGTTPELVYPVAAALECIHSYSLIHDDLPCMDNDDLRRGQPTNHKVYGVAVALLAGDALLTKACALIVSDYAGIINSDCIKVALVKEITAAIGSQGMIGGQVVDIESENKEIDFSVMQYIHTHKTGALIYAAARSGAIIGQADKLQLQAVSRYAECIGLAFQIVDDILDIEGDQELLGKPIGSDQQLHKATYPAIFGLSESHKKASELLLKAQEALAPFGKPAHVLQELAEFVVNRKH